MSGQRSVVVEGVEIPESLIAREAQNHPGANAAAAWREAGRALAVKALLIHRARELGLAPAPLVDADGREETQEAALIRAVLDAEVEGAPPSDAACRREYDAHPERFRTPPLYEASHILIEAGGETGLGPEMARAAAERLIEQLAREPGRFPELARAMSACSSAREGGSLGQLRAGDLVREIEDALAALAPGEIAPTPIASRFGWHVIRLDRRVEGRQLPFEYVVDRIRVRLEGRSWMEAAARYAAWLAARAREQGVALSLAADARIAEGSMTLGGLTLGGQTLGDLLGEDALTRFGPWLEAADPALAAMLTSAAGAEGCPSAALARRLVSHFAATADDASWTQLISASQRAEDPAVAAIAVILRAKLAPRRASVTLLKAT